MSIYIYIYIYNKYLPLQAEIISHQTKSKVGRCNLVMGCYRSCWCSVIEAPRVPSDRLFAKKLKVHLMYHCKVLAIQLADASLESIENRLTVEKKLPEKHKVFGGETDFTEAILRNGLNVPERRRWDGDKSPRGTSRMCCMAIIVQHVRAVLLAVCQLLRGGVALWCWERIPWCRTPLASRRHDLTGRSLRQKSRWPHYAF